MEEQKERCGEVPDVIGWGGKMVRDLTGDAL